MMEISSIYSLLEPPKENSSDSENEKEVSYDDIKIDSYKNQMKAFQSNFNKEELSDLTLVINKKLIFHVNKFLLASNSTVFYKMFYDPIWIKNK